MDDLAWQRKVLAHLNWNSEKGQKGYKILITVYNQELLGAAVTMLTNYLQRHKHQEMRLEITFDLDTGKAGWDFIKRTGQFLKLIQKVPKYKNEVWLEVRYYDGSLFGTLKFGDL